jgi:hypothetical protein
VILWKNVQGIYLAFAQTTSISFFSLSSGNLSEKGYGQFQTKEIKLSYLAPLEWFQSNGKALPCLE